MNHEVAAPGDSSWNGAGVGKQAGQAPESNGLILRAGRQIASISGLTQRSDRIRVVPIVAQQRGLTRLAQVVHKNPVLTQGSDRDGGRYGLVFLEEPPVRGVVTVLLMRQRDLRQLDPIRLDRDGLFLPLNGGTHADRPVRCRMRGLNISQGTRANHFGRRQIEAVRPFAIHIVRDRQQRTGLLNELDFLHGRPGTGQHRGTLRRKRLEPSLVLLIHEREDLDSRLARTCHRRVLAIGTDRRGQCLTGQIPFAAFHQSQVRCRRLLEFGIRELTFPGRNRGHRRRVQRQHKTVRAGRDRPDRHLSQRFLHQ